MRLEDFIDRERLADLDRPIGETAGLPGSAYSEGFYKLEQREFFPRTWCAIAVGSQVPRPGDVIPIDLAGWPLLLVRNQSGQIKVFHNMCQHRGMRVVTKSACRQELRCPWHAWTYDLDGRLKTRRDFAGWNAPDAGDMNAELPGLKEVRSDQWHDYVMVNIDGKAPPLRDHIKPLDDFLQDYDLDAFEYANTLEHSYEGNWKLAMEGGLEEYHLRSAHPRFAKGVISQNLEFSLDAACHSGYLFSRNFGETERADRVGERGMPARPGTPRDVENYYLINLFPVGLMLLEDDHAIFILFTPDGWNRTRVVNYHYYFGAAAVDPAYAEVRKEFEDVWTEVMYQDADFVKYVHENAQLRDAVGINSHFAPYWERPVQHFQRLVIDTMKNSSDG